MTNEEKKVGDDNEDDIFDVISQQTKKIGELLDYNQAIVKTCRLQADNWRNLSRAYIECAQMASEIADQSALIARISVERSGEIISTEWGIEAVDIDDDDNDLEIEEEDE